MKKNKKLPDIVIGNRKGRREADFELGWTSKTKKHATLKDYSRNEKYRINPNNITDEDDN